MRSTLGCSGVKSSRVKGKGRVHERKALSESK